MEDLIIHATKISPEVIFQCNGKLKIHGKIITENAVLTFDPIFNWIAGFQGDEVEFDIFLDYMNTSASMQLFILLNKLDLNFNIENIKVNWFYDEDDEEHFETGELFEDRLERVKFNYIRVKEEKSAA
ncbi:MAG TPA: hypothetical protein DDX98_02940 [Bacteroidales bacterium]|mgnify:CR=1 FL=1|jgi:hypothetical protein|nr:hypothetical protein [Bacteroidales bacterium]